MNLTKFNATSLPKRCARISINPIARSPRFLNFLEDEALARIRLAVSFAIMQGLATQAAKSNDAGENSV
ncbi:MAG: hypothetical protein V5B44_05275 [Candidatus Accumulibacter necessarius]|jgi:hypothetical protein|uniref:hypothetical protein n=1 Tax=Candidatus Accumulibacter necessarius TaxID=2954386 RepID=UPI002FC3B033